MPAPVGRGADKRLRVAIQHPGQGRIHVARIPSVVNALDGAESPNRFGFDRRLAEIPSSVEFMPAICGMYLLFGKGPIQVVHVVLKVWCSAVPTG